MLDEDSKIIRDAFEKVIPHIVNLDHMKNVVEAIINSCEELNQAIEKLESKLNGNAEVTVITDMRILLNELRHLLFTRESIR